MSRNTPKGPGHLREISETFQNLDDEFSNMIEACTIYDNGERSRAAKKMSNSLRHLFKNGGGTKSLFHQLTISQIGLRDTAAMNHGEMLRMCIGITIDERLNMDFDSDEKDLPVRDWEPVMDLDGPPVRVKSTKWWDATLFKDDNGHSWSRRTIVEAVAEEDGGTHTDRELSDHYFQLSRNAIFQYGMMITQADADGNQQVIDDPRMGKIFVYALLRQISHEVLSDLHSILHMAQINSGLNAAY